MIVYAWVNDQDMLRKAGAGTDPYAVFTRMLTHGNPPEDWSALLKAAQDAGAVKRFVLTDEVEADKPA